MDVCSKIYESLTSLGENFNQKGFLLPTDVFYGTVSKEKAYQSPKTKFWFSDIF